MAGHHFDARLQRHVCQDTLYISWHEAWLLYVLCVCVWVCEWFMHEYLQISSWGLYLELMKAFGPVSNSWILAVLARLCVHVIGTQSLQVDILHCRSPKGARVNNKNNIVCEMKGRYLLHNLEEFGLQTPGLKIFCHWNKQTKLVIDSLLSVADSNVKGKKEPC